MTLTLAITTYNRFDLLKESFSEVIDDPRIGEVLILDDCSSASYWNKIAALTHPKIRAIRQAANRGMMQNKADAIAYARNEWVIIFDSDNILKPDYLDAFEADNFLHPEIIYCPDFAWPSFDYRKFSDSFVGRFNAADFIKDELGFMCLNTCNYIVNRDAYMKVYKHNPDMKGTDTIYFAHLWLKANNSFHVVKGMTYFHRVHKDSGFMADFNYNMIQAEKIKRLILEL